MEAATVGEIVLVVSVVLLVASGVVIVALNIVIKTATQFRILNRDLFGSNNRSSGRNKNSGISSSSSSCTISSNCCCCCSCFNSSIIRLLNRVNQKDIFYDYLFLFVSLINYRELDC